MAPNALSVMIPLPGDLARQFPYDEERGKPHVTLLWIGEYDPAQKEDTCNLLRGIEWPDIDLELGDLEYFEKPDRRVAYVAIEPNEELAALHTLLKETLETSGLPISRHEGSFKPHATLSYLALEEEHTGSVPQGTWTAQPEIWYGPSRAPVDKL